MANVKTAVSIERPLFEQAEALAREMNVSRSRFFALALEDFLRRHQSQEMLARINEAYEDGPQPAEQLLQHARRQQHRRIVEGEW